MPPCRRSARHRHRPTPTRCLRGGGKLKGRRRVREGRDSAGCAAIVRPPRLRRSGCSVSKASTKLQGHGCHRHNRAGDRRGERADRRGRGCRTMAAVSHIHRTGTCDLTDHLAHVSAYHTLVSRSRLAIGDPKARPSNGCREAPSEFSTTSPPNNGRSSRSARRSAYAFYTLRMRFVVSVFACIDSAKATSRAAR